MAENQVNPLFNIHEKYREVIIINPYRFSDPDAVAQAARIVADGGTVVNFAFMNLVISTMKSMGIYQYNKLLTSGDFGVRINPSTGALNKLYDISGNNNDAVQATGANQPIWSPVGSSGIITYGGSKCMDISSVISQIGSSTTGTWIVRINLPNATPASYGTIMSFGQTSGLQRLMLYNGTDGKLNGYFQQGVGNYWALTTNNAVFVNNINTTVSITHNGTQPVLYVDSIAVPQNFSITTDKTKWFNGSVLNNGRMGALNFNNLGNADYINGQINSSIIFNISPSQSQITQLYNLGL